MSDIHITLMVFFATIALGAGTIAVSLSVMNWPRNKDSSSDEEEVLTPLQLFERRLMPPRLNWKVYPAITEPSDYLSFSRYYNERYLKVLGIALSQISEVKQCPVLILELKDCILYASLNDAVKQTAFIKAVSRKNGRHLKFTGVNTLSALDELYSVTVSTLAEYSNE